MCMYITNNNNATECFLSLDFKLMTYWGTKIVLNLKNTVDLTMHVIKFLLIVIHAPPRPVTPTCRYLNQNALKQHTATVWTQQERCQITYDNYTPQLFWKVFVGTLGSRLAQRREVSRWCEQQKSLTREMSARGRRWKFTSFYGPKFTSPHRKYKCQRVYFTC